MQSNQRSFTACSSGISPFFGAKRLFASCGRHRLPWKPHGEVNPVVRGMEHPEGVESGTGLERADQITGIQIESRNDAVVDFRQGQGL
jgi:hypothetical protein